LDRKYLEVFLIWPIITKVRHTLAHLPLWEKALISLSLEGQYLLRDSFSLLNKLFVKST
jgi:hypothetical protein